MKTERLILRLRTKAYLLEIKNASKTTQMKMVGVSFDDDLALELGRIDRLLKIPEDNYRLWDIIHKGSLEVLGNLGFHNYKQEHYRSEIGYGLNKKHRRKGYMKEALNRILDYGFTDMNLQRVEANISPDNIASNKLVQRLGFTREGLLRKHYYMKGTFYDSYIYSLLREEWKDSSV